jgi:hypothetical protein
MFHQSPPRIEAHFASPTLSQMISLDLVDELPPSYDAFSLADIRTVFEDTTMELDDYATFQGPDAPHEPDFWSRSDEPGLRSMQQYMLENSDFSIVSGNDIGPDFEFKDPPVDSSGLPGKCFRQNQHMVLTHEGGCDALHSLTGTPTMHLSMLTMLITCRTKLPRRRHLFE